MLANGFNVRQLVELVRAGLATGASESVAMGARAVEVAKGMITEAGWRALIGRNTP
jgi:hypothetical protein